jgi:hypothetical protein
MTNPNPTQLEHYVSSLEFPASRDELVRQATERGAEEQVVETLRKLPATEFSGPESVSSALSEMSDAPGSPGVFRSGDSDL